jgi:hypothetical protein
MDVMPAPLARVGLAARVAVVLSNALTLLASGAVWIAAAPKPLQTGVFVGIVALKVCDGVSLHPVLTSYEGILPDVLPTVKG